MDKQSKKNKIKISPASYRSSYAKDIIEFMSNGYSLSACAAQLNVNCDLLYQWQKEKSEFAAAIKLGEAKRLLFWEQKLLDPDLKPTFLRAILFTLQNICPQEWTEKVDTNWLNNMAIEQIELVAPEFITKQRIINKDTK